MVRERAYNGIPGLPMLLALILADAGFIWMLAMNIRSESPREIVLAAVLIALATFLTAGLFMVNPNEGKVLQLFGEYKGTAKIQGLRWANPFFTKKKVSLRVRNFESSHLKVNDIDGNPIEIAAVVVWKVFETAEAVFEVDDYEHYVKVQSEAALRNLATSYAYDAHEEGQMSLRGSTAEVAGSLKTEIQDRLEKAGVKVMEARISLRARDRGRDAAAPAGGGHHRGAPEDRRGRRRHGRERARAAVEARDRRARQRAQGRDGQQPLGRPVQRIRSAAGHQHRHAVHLTP